MKYAPAASSMLAMKWRTLSIGSFPACSAIIPLLIQNADINYAGRLRIMR
jgi:hypothetical protein